MWLSKAFKIRLHRKNCGKGEIAHFDQFHLISLCFPKAFFSNVLKRVWVCMEERVKLCTSGPRVWLRWHKEIDVCADLGYFILTTLSGTYS